ncbi:PilZ domain-containing protein [uncultured Desulfosarcina sp.]|uniref:PilZ domain-containing protein n=1 Tax=uncultured Desulfosarcina sp. TaxID=218289 RepID=UPI0029C8AECE|nr:PilZ domain-containing protein [uncultured Desulfosarcina sp.]
MNDSNVLENEKKLTDRLIQGVSKLSFQRKKMLEELLHEWDRLDYREDSRIPCFLPVDYSTATRVYQDFINNLSNGGVFIETAAALREGQSISLIFTVPNLQKSFKISGTIVRTERDGIGVKFSKKLTPYQKELINSAIGPK